VQHHHAVCDPLIPAHHDPALVLTVQLAVVLVLAVVLFLVAAYR